MLRSATHKPAVVESRTGFVVDRSSVVRNPYFPTATCLRPKQILCGESGGYLANRHKSSSLTSDIPVDVFSRLKRLANGRRCRIEVAYAARSHVLPCASCTYVCGMLQ